jgi:hypothetical protein
MSSLRAIDLHERDERAARAEMHFGRGQERRDQILARFRAGAKPPLIANELGLNQQAVWRIVRELASDADRTARARVLADRRQPRFSDAELLDGLVRVAQRLGWVPSDAEYDRVASGLGLASSTTLYTVLAAGRARSRRRGSRRRRRGGGRSGGIRRRAGGCWSRWRISSAIRLATAATGSSP